MSNHITLLCTWNNFPPEMLHWLLVSFSLHISLRYGTFFWYGMLLYMLLSLEVL